MKEKRPEPGKLRILLLDDEPLDVERILSVLHQNGIGCEIVDRSVGVDFAEALLASGCGLVLADYSLRPFEGLAFDGMEALRIVRRTCPDLPFIFCSNIPGEEHAIEALQQGATDYVLKHRLQRLAPAIRRSLSEAADRRQRRSIEADMQATIDGERMARQQAEAANHLRDEFLAIVIHELRTPLTPILGWAHRLRSGPLPADVTARALETIERSAQLQNRLIRDLLDASRSLGGKLRLNLQEVEPRRFIDAAVNTVTLAADDKRINLSVDVAPEAQPICGDPDRLQQIVWNLLANAIRFTPDGGCVDLSYTQSETSVRITVNDTGQGITPDFLPHVFDRFAQADRASGPTHDGLGLGLAIVRHPADQTEKGQAPLGRADGPPARGVA